MKGKRFLRGYLNRVVKAWGRGGLEGVNEGAKGTYVILPTIKIFKK